jgi:hypothetical protein
MNAFTKVRYAGGKVELGIVAINGESSDKIECTSNEDPRPEFSAALQGLRRFLPQILDLPADYFEGNSEEGKPPVQVTGISIRSIAKSDRRGYVITFTKEVSGANAPWAPATPFLIEPKEDTGEHAYRRELFEALDRVVKEAELYRKGVRAQQELPLPGRRTEEALPLDDELVARRSEAEARRRRMWPHFREALPSALKLSIDGFASADVKDDELYDLIAEEWDDVAHEFEGTEFTGLVRTPADGEGQVVYSYVIGGPKLAYFFDVEAPDHFQRHAAVPDLNDDDVLRWARHHYWPDDHGDPVDAEILAENRGAGPRPVAELTADALALAE